MKKYLTGFYILETMAKELPSHAHSTAPKVPADEPIRMEGGLPLAEDGTSQYVIVRGENASPSEVTAAEEFRSYFREVTGADLPIVTDAAAPVPKEIVIGKTNREPSGAFDRETLGEDGFIIKTEGTKLWIVGGEQRGTLYGVYEFLQAYLGCRFYTETFEKIPRRSTVILAVCENRQVPMFDTRAVYWSDCFGEKIKAKLRINCARNGKLPESLGGSHAYAGSPCHTLYHLAEMTGHHFSEPCITSEETYRTVLKNVRALLDANPDARFVSVSQNDGYAERVGCECENCMAAYNRYGCWSGAYLEFVNRIAREIKKDYPHVMIHTFAYRFTRECPRGIVPEDNVMIQFCTIEACLRHSMEEYASRTPAEKYDPLHDFKALVSDWSKICNYLSVWDYTTDFSHYSLPFPNFRSLRQNIRMFAENRVKNAFEQGAYQGPNGEFGELRGYVIAKLLWNPMMSEEAYWDMIREFVMDFYGAGGEKILDYINAMHEETEDVCMDCYVDPLVLYGMTEARENHPAHTYPEELTADMIRDYRNVDWTAYRNWFKGLRKVPETITVGYRAFGEAYAMAETDEERAHVEKTSIQVDYLTSYYLHTQLRFSDVETILDNFFKAHPEAFTAEEQETLKSNITAFAEEQSLEGYADFNRRLYEKMLRYGADRINEGAPLLRDSERINYRSVPGSCLM